VIYIVMTKWDIKLTALTDLSEAQRAARACGGYIVFVKNR